MSVGVGVSVIVSASASVSVVVSVIVSVMSRPRRALLQVPVSDANSALLMCMKRLQRSVM